MDRKGMKANARKAYKRHYWMIVVICLFASVFGVAYSSSTWSVNASSPSATVQEDGTAQSDNVSKVLENLLVGDESQARRQVEHNQEQIDTLSDCAVPSSCTIRSRSCKTTPMP